MVLEFVGEIELLKQLAAAVAMGLAPFMAFTEEFVGIREGAEEWSEVEETETEVVEEEDVVDRVEKDLFNSLSCVSKGKGGGEGLCNIL